MWNHLSVKKPGRRQHDGCKPAGSVSWLLPVESVGNRARIREAGSKTNNLYCTTHIFRAHPEAASQLQRQGLIMTGAEVVTWTAA